MKLTEIFDTRAHMELERFADRNAALRTPQGRDALMAQAARRARDIDQASAASAAGGQVWLIDRASGKKLAGPFKDEEAAGSFKTNRKDRIPADAAVKRL